MKKKVLALVLSLFFLQCLWAQDNPFMNDANGRPLYRQTNYRVEGTPYYHDGYTIAEITSLYGKVYPPVNVKFNIQTNEVLYMADDGTEMVATMPIRRIRLIGFMSPEGARDRILESFSEQPLNATNAPVYEKIDTGRITVLKQIKITYIDNKEFNQSTVVRNFKRKETWHLLSANGVVKNFETGKEAMLATLTDKPKEITAYIDKEKLKCRSVEDCRKVIRYYNTLFL